MYVEVIPNREGGGGGGRTPNPESTQPKNAFELIKTLNSTAAWLGNYHLYWGTARRSPVLSGVRLSVIFRCFMVPFGWVLVSFDGFWPFRCLFLLWFGVFFRWGSVLVVFPGVSSHPVLLSGFCA